MTNEQNFVQQDIENFHITEEPFYVSTSDEVEIFESAYKQRVPVLLKGPTGTGKTRFVEYMAWKLSNSSIKKNISNTEKLPLITVACHEDLNASDLVGRYLLDAN